jgi:FkbM family methyltransferase
MSKIKSLAKEGLRKILGTEDYLKFISRGYFIMFSKGLLGKSQADVYYLRQLIKPGDTCIDIGGNLGYYTVPLSKYVYPGGMIITVEPVPLFAKILRKNVELFGKPVVSVNQVALGKEEGATITMGTPSVGGTFRHGCTKIKEDESENFADTYEVIMRNPKNLFSNLQKIDFIKCDVEGYELVIFNELMPLIEKHRPIILIEFQIEHKQKIHKMLSERGYKMKILVNNILKEISLDSKEHPATDNFYFIP